MPNYITVTTANQNTYQNAVGNGISVSGFGDQVLLASGATISSAAANGHGIYGDLPAGEVFLVLMGSVESANSAGIRMASNGTRVIIGPTGEVSGGTSGILLSDFMFGSGGNWVENWGSVKGTGAIGIGIGANFSDNNLSNRGTVEGFKGIVAGSAGSKNNKVSNSGSILSSGTGVELWGDGSSLTNNNLIRSSGFMAQGSDFAVVLKSNAGETITVMNTGTIESFFGEEGKAILGGLGSDRIVNYGKITGYVELGGGNDLYDGKDGAVIGEIDMGDGNDSVYGSTFDAGVRLGAGDDLYDGRGGQANRLINLGHGNDTAFGGSHNDSLDGGEGNDWLSGGDGDDTLDLGLGDDIGIGGSGDDWFLIAGSFGADTIDGGAGVDTLSMGYAGGVSFTINLSVTGLQNTGAWGNIQLSGIENVKSIEGNDLLIGSSESNKLVAGFGLDTLEGGLGNDVLDGDVGFDFARFTGSMGAKVNLANTAAQATGYGTDTFIGIEGLIGGAGADNFTGDLNGNDMFANAGKDTLSGGAGADYLSGGLGNDRLTGGADSDFFYFDAKLNAKTNVDTITDFSRVDDRIDLENAIFKKLTSTGVLSKLSFVVGAKAKDKNDYIVYDKAKGTLSYDADGSGKGAAVKFAQLKKGLVIDHKDFFVI